MSGILIYMKRIIIITGVTGAIGSALLAEYAQNKENIIYGISRKALPLDSFLINEKLPQTTLICRIQIPEEWDKLCKAINFSDIEEVIYIHGMGHYAFEVSKDGVVAIENDQDGDGINDETFRLTYIAFTTAINELETHWNGSLKTVIFGGIADIHRPAVHQSWWKTIERTKLYMQNFASTHPLSTMLVFNISSVLCPHEIITRPFVFIHTDADQTKWLNPHELAEFVVEKVSSISSGFQEIEKFRRKENFDVDTYYKDESFTPRKVQELF
jgi:hypothetical protein